VGPRLAGVGARLSAGQIRLRLADGGRRANPDTLMPAYLRTEGLTRVAPAWRGRPVLTPEELEDVVAFLTTLREG
jgi:sulfur-oxidizing protein SoxX